MTLKIGIAGLGMMGWTHLDVYSKRDDVEVVAVTDHNPARLSGKERAGGNIDGQAQGGFDLSKARQYASVSEMIANNGLDIIDICLPTPEHLNYGQKVLAAGKHLLIEKPLARTYEEARALVDAAENSSGIAMPAMCMRFWPGWSWLKDVVENQTYGKVLAANFRRITSHPPGRFYASGEATGGAALDLHIHDTDFIQYLFGVPEAVSSGGYSAPTTHTDHIHTRYIYPDGPLVTAEGSWALAKGYGFSMQFTVNFEYGTALYGQDPEHPLILINAKEQREPVEVVDAMGYDLEIDYFLDCVKSSRKPEIVTLDQAAEAVRIVEAEVASVVSGDATQIAALQSA